MAQYHTYHNGTYSGINLHVLTTNASNIQLVNLNEKSSLKGSSYYGINGGFFVMGENLLISLALNNGYQVGPGEQGTDNKWNGGGAIAWNGYAFEVYTPIQTKSQLSSKVAGGRAPIASPELGPRAVTPCSSGQVTGILESSRNCPALIPPLIRRKLAVPAWSQILCLRQCTSM